MTHSKKAVESVGLTRVKLMTIVPDAIFWGTIKTLRSLYIVWCCAVWHGVRELPVSVVGPVLWCSGPTTAGEGAQFTCSFHCSFLQAGSKACLEYVRGEW